MTQLRNEIKRGTIPKPNAERKRRNDPQICFQICNCQASLKLGRIGKIGNPWSCRLKTGNFPHG